MPTLAIASTVVPTEVPAEVPTEVSAVVPADVPTVEATEVRPADVTPVVTATPVREPSPTPYGKVPGFPVAMAQQTVFPLMTTDLPDYLESGELSRWPVGSELISRGVNFVVWAVAFDMSEVSEDFVLDGYVRWVQMTSEVESVVMLESPVALSKAEPLFYEGLGRNYPGVLEPGNLPVGILGQ